MRPQLLLALMLALVVAADNPPEDAVKKERKKLEGTWTVESATLDGKPLKRPPAEIVFADDRITMQNAGKKETMRYMVDPSKKPKTMGFALPQSAPKNAVPGRAIYELKGDTLRIAIGRPDSRPTRFDDDHVTLFTLKRKKS